MSIDERLAEVYQRVEKNQDSMGRIAIIESIRELEHRVDELEDFKAYVQGLVGPVLTIIKGGKCAEPPEAE